MDSTTSIDQRCIGCTIVPYFRSWHLARPSVASRASDSTDPNGTNRYLSSILYSRPIPNSASSTCEARCSDAGGRTYPPFPPLPSLGRIDSDGMHTGHDHQQGGIHLDSTQVANSTFDRGVLPVQRSRSSLLYHCQASRSMGIRGVDRSFPTVDCNVA